MKKKPMISNNAISIEKRLQERFPMQLPVRISVLGTEQQAETSFETVTLNISSGGAFILTDTPPPVASRINLEFLIAFRDLIKLRFILSLDALRRFEGKPVWVQASGVVIRHDSEGMAVIFDNDYQLSPMRYSETPEG